MLSKIRPLGSYHKTGWRWLRVLAAIYLLFMATCCLYPIATHPAYSHLVYDRQGQLLHATLSSDDKWRMEVLPADITPLLKQAILAKEDQYFYYHPGVNPLAIGRALVRNIWRGRTTSGASTITMQVVRLLEPRPRTLLNKMIEAWRALQLEYTCSKEEILCLYLSLAPYGGNVEGIKAASWLYFQKNPNHLSAAEIASLAVIPNRPNSLNPARQPQRLLQARNSWLTFFAKKGLISKNTLADALAEPLGMQRHPLPRMAPHASRRLIKSSATYAITSTLDAHKQQMTEQLVSAYLRSIEGLGIRQAAVLVVNNSTMQVEAYVGSGNFADTTDGGQVDGITAIRQPGSTLKPLLYGLAIDVGLLTPKTMLTDVPTNYGGFTPENYNQQFNGMVTMQYALEHSLNIPAVRTLQALGKNQLIGALSQAQFTQVQKDQAKLGLSMVLGGCGASLQQLTGLFTCLANGGIYKPLQLLMPTSNPTNASGGTRLLSNQACYMLSDILSQVMRPDFPINWGATEKTPRIAWKTGTSYGRRDAWSIGYNPQYTIGVWLGNFSGRGVPDLSGASIATPLLFKVFNAIDYNSQTAWYEPPAGCESRLVCAETGQLPAPHCTGTVMDYFIPGISNEEICNNRQQIKISADGSHSYCAQCAPQTGYKWQWYYTPGPELLAWLLQQGRPVVPIPPHNPQCTVVFAGGGPQIESPSRGSRYYLSSTQPEPLQLYARAGPDASKLYWYINDQFYKTTLPAEKAFYMPAAGMQKIVCTDDKGRKAQVICEVEIVKF